MSGDRYTVLDNTIIYLYQFAIAMTLANQINVMCTHYNMVTLIIYSLDLECSRIGQATTRIGLFEWCFRIECV